MGLQSFVAGVVVQVIEDERTQAVAEKLVGQVMTKYVTPVIPAAIAAAIDKAFDRITDLNNDGKPDVQQVAEAAHDVIGGLLPDFLKPFLPVWH